jgi:hypothetical protein
MWGITGVVELTVVGKLDLPSKRAWAVLSKLSVLADSR